MTYFLTKLSIRCYDCDLHDSNDKDHRNYREEAKDIVVTGLLGPYALENERELNENDGEGNESSKQQTLSLFSPGSITGLDLPRNGTSLNGVFILARFDKT